MLTGYKTLIFNMLTPVFLYLGAKGIPMDEETKLQLSLLVMAIGNAIMRTITTTTAPWVKKPKQRKKRRKQPPPVPPPAQQEQYQDPSNPNNWPPQ